MAAATSGTAIVATLCLDFILSCLRLVNQVSEVLLVVKNGAVVLDVAARALLLETRPFNVLRFGKDNDRRVG